MALKVTEQDELNHRMIIKQQREKEGIVPSPCHWAPIPTSLPDYVLRAGGDKEKQ